MAEDDIVQLIEDPGHKPAEQGPRWKVAVIDDDAPFRRLTGLTGAKDDTHGLVLEVFPNEFHQAGPFSTMSRTQNSVSMLLISVGNPNSPTWNG